MEHLAHLIYIIPVGMGLPVLMFGGATAIIERLFGCLPAAHRWRIYGGIGLLGSGTLNLTMALITAGTWLTITLGWWQPSTPISAREIIVTIGTGMNAGICGVLLWTLYPQPTAPWRDRPANCKPSP